MSELKAVWVNDKCKYDEWFPRAGERGGIATRMVEWVDAEAALAERDEEIAAIRRNNRELTDQRVELMEEIVIDGVTYYDADKGMSFDDAVKWAEENGLRLLQRGEWCKLWDSSEEFRKSCAGKYWWTASVYSTVCNNAWDFSGYDGYVYGGNRDNTNSVRCVKKEAGR